MEKNFTFKTTYLVYANPDQVFEALTNSGIIAAWGGGLSVVEDRIGGVFELFDGWVKGEITAYQPGKELGFTWKPEEWKKGIKPSLVHLTFKKDPAGTAIILDHTKFPNQEEATKHGNGWIDYVLDPLNDYFVMQKESETPDEQKN
jgi:uncharacterized protein YndB with AHSA1/START domain